MLAAALLLTAAAPPGLWLTQDHHGVVAITQCGPNLCGSIVGIGRFRPDGGTPVDAHGTPDCHLQIMPSMVPGDDGAWHGDIYDPESGKTYHAEFHVDDQDRLLLRGYVGIPLFGSTQTWTRYTGQVTADCHMVPPPPP